MHGWYDEESHCECDKAAQAIRAKLQPGAAIELVETNVPLAQRHVALRYVVECQPNGIMTIDAEGEQSFLPIGCTIPKQGVLHYECNDEGFTITMINGPGEPAHYIKYRYRPDQGAIVCARGSRPRGPRS